MTFPDIADVGNTEQPMMVVEQGVNNNDNNMPQTPLPSGVGAGASSSESVPRPPSPLQCPRPPSPPLATKTPPIHRMVNSYEPKMKSSVVDLFLKVLKNKPKRAPASSKESPNVQVLKKVLDEKSLTGTSFQKQKEEHISMFSSDEMLDKYEHGKPFLFRRQLNEGASKLMRLHTWIMQAMKQGIHTITASVPKWVFSSSLKRKVAIDFHDLHVMYLSYGPPWAHYLGGYQDRLLGGPLGLPGLRYTAPEGVEHKDYGGEVLG
jgi:hypothetical protein